MGVQGELYSLPRGGPLGARRVGAPGGPSESRRRHVLDSNHHNFFIIKKNFIHESFGIAVFVGGVEDHEETFF